MYARQVSRIPIAPNVYHVVDGEFRSVCPLHTHVLEPREVRRELSEREDLALCALCRQAREGQTLRKPSGRATTTADRIGSL
jgi:hypothetical protein